MKTWPRLREATSVLAQELARRIIEMWFIMTISDGLHVGTIFSSLKTTIDWLLSRRRKTTNTRQQHEMQFVLVQWPIREGFPYFCYIAGWRRYLTRFHESTMMTHLFIDWQAADSVNPMTCSRENHQLKRHSVQCKWLLKYYFRQFCCHIFGLFFVNNGLVTDRKAFLSGIPNYFPFTECVFPWHPMCYYQTLKPNCGRPRGRGKQPVWLISPWGWLVQLQLGELS